MPRKTFPFLFFLACFVLAPGLKAEAVAFPDVPQSHWAYHTINYMTGGGILAGYSDGLFRPQQNLTRAELATMLFKITGGNAPLDSTLPFSDVPTDTWYRPAVSGAASFFRYDPSFKEGLFRPGDQVTRVEAAAAVAAARGLEPANDEGWAARFFTDGNTVPLVYRDIIDAALKGNVIRGYEDGTIRPRGLLTRAEAAALLYGSFILDTSIASVTRFNLAKILEQHGDSFPRTSEALQRQYGKIGGKNVAFSTYDLSSYRPGVNLLLVFARVDPLAYFPFSGTVFPYDKEQVKKFAEDAALAASALHPGFLAVALAGYTNLLYYNPYDAYGDAYTAYDSQVDGWRITRYYAGAACLDGTVKEIWLENQQ